MDQCLIDCPQGFTNMSNLCIPSTKLSSSISSTIAYSPKFPLPLALTFLGAAIFILILKCFDDKNILSASLCAVSGTFEVGG